MERALSELIIAMGHNPGTNHPRMMGTLRGLAQRRADPRLQSAKFERNRDNNFSLTRVSGRPILKLALLSRIDRRRDSRLGKAGQVLHEELDVER